MAVPFALAALWGELHISDEVEGSLHTMSGMREALTQKIPNFCLCGSDGFAAVPMVFLCFARSVNS